MNLPVTAKEAVVRPSYAAPSSVVALRSAMISLDRMVGWFPHTPVEWIELITVALLLWLLTVVAISELELNSVIPI